MGDSADLARQLRRAHGGIADMLRRTVTGAWLLGAVGLVAIGVSGLLAELLGRTLGAHGRRRRPAGGHLHRAAVRRYLQ
ncbi:hypothetical protein JNW88_12290, partial [Micromonospora sp. ATA32]|nr:hypothetical protein [Micromonospora sp. ATA32]